MGSLHQPAARGAAAGTLVGLCFGYLELAVGCGLAGAFPSVGERLPAPNVIAEVLLADAGIGALLGVLAGALMGRARRARASILAAAVVAGGLATVGLLAFLLGKTQLLYTAWGTWRGPLLVAGGVAGLLAGSVFALLQSRVPSRLVAQHEALAACVLGLLGFLAVWTPAAGAELLSGKPLLPLLRPWPLALVPWLVLAGGSLARHPARHLAGAAAFATTLGILFVPAIRSGRPDELAPAQPDTAVGAAPVILIVADTLRADHLPTYGYSRNTAPHLDAFARRASVFERCISPSPWTVPSHASLFTGLYPRSHGAHLSPERRTERLGLPEELETLAESFRAAGYRTFGAAANTWLRAGSGFEQGFEAWDDAQRRRPLLPPLVVPIVRALASAPGTPEWLDRVDQQLSRLVLPYPSFDEMAASARRWIAQAGDQPFLLFVNAMETHDPFKPPEPFASAWPGRGSRGVPFHHVRERVMRGEWELEPWMRDHLVSQYDGEISSLDHQLGAFFDWLHESGVFERSWIVVTSDHGEHLGERGLLWHRVSLFDPLVHVPLLVKRPGQTVGERAGGKVQLVDILPTLLGAAGLPVPPGVQGKSLWEPRDAAFAELYRDSWIVEEHGERYDRDLLSYEDGRWKLIRSSDGSEELLDLEADPATDRGVAGSPPQTRERLAEQLERFLEKLPRPEAREDKALDEASRERLRELGYIE